MEPWDIRDSLSVKLWDISNCIAISSNIPYDGEMSDINEDQVQKDLDWWTLCQVTTRSILTYYENYLYKVPCRTSMRTGHMFLEEILNGHGWEGAAHDNRIFGEAIRRSDLNFPHPKGKKYYLVDAGYSHMPGYMGPYRGENIRYHLEDFRRAKSGQRAPRNLKEKFNYYHSSCRNCIERTFGVWKARWNILADMPYFHIDTQREIVLATMAIHNYIRKKKIADKAFQIAEDESYEPDTDHSVKNSTANVEDEDNPRSGYWMALRDSIAMEIARRDL